MFIVIWEVEDYTSIDGLVIEHYISIFSKQELAEEFVLKKTKEFLPKNPCSRIKRVLADIRIDTIKMDDCSELQTDNWSYYLKNK